MTAINVPQATPKNPIVLMKRVLKIVPATIIMIDPAAINCGLSIEMQTDAETWAIVFTRNASANIMIMGPELSYPRPIHICITCGAETAKKIKSGVTKKLTYFKLLRYASISLGRWPFASISENAGMRAEVKTEASAAILMTMLLPS